MSPFEIQLSYVGSSRRGTTIDDLNLIEALGQVSASEAGVIFRNFLRGAVRQMICEVMAAEVTALCGPKYHPNDSGNVRTGSSSGLSLIHI